MSDTLGALLRGFNNGVGTGLDLYKTVQSEARAKRQEEYGRERDALSDMRLDRQWDHTLGQAAQAQSNRVEDVAHRDEVFQHTKQKDADAAAAAERRHKELMRYNNSRLAALGDKNKIAATKEFRVRSKEYETEIGNTVKGDESLAATSQLLNTNPAYAVVMADKLGLPVTGDDIQGVYAIPTANGLMLARRGEDGKDAPWDPDGDGNSGILIPRTLVQSVFGGVDGAAAAGAANLAAGQSAALSQAAEAEAKEQELAARTASSDAGSEAALVRAQLEAHNNSPEAQAVAARDASYNGAPPSVKTAAGLADLWAPGAGALAGRALEAVTPTPRTVDSVVGAGRDSINGLGDVLRTVSPLYNKVLPEKLIERELPIDVRNRVEGERASLAAREQELTRTAATQDRRAEEAKDAPAEQQAAWTGVVQDINRMPAKDRTVALKNSRETAAQLGVTVAKRYPGKNPVDSTELMQKDTKVFIDDIVGSMDFSEPSTLGKIHDKVRGKETLHGGEATLRAVLENSNSEIVIGLMDHTSSVKGAMRLAAQKAVSDGKPEGILYYLHADHLGLDSKAAVEVMQDTALAQVENDAQRFEYAAEALNMVKRGEAKSPTEALGRLLGGMKK